MVLGSVIRGSFPLRAAGGSEGKGSTLPLDALDDPIIRDAGYEVVT
jgi:hypothetical protein